MTRFTESSEVRTTEHCLSTTIDGETVVLHVEDGKYYGFNEVGTAIWDLLQQPRTIGELCREVSSQYDVAYERCRSDVEELLREMVDNDLVRVDT